MSSPDERKAWLRARIILWREAPWLFVKEMVGATPDAWQDEALRELVVHRRLSISSCHGVGKDTLASWIILWMMFCFPHPKIPCTAPTAHQLYDLLWSELSKWFNQMPPAFRSLFVLRPDRFERKANKETWFAVARTARKENSEALQGFHAKHLAVVVDEASGVPDISFEVLEGAMTEEGSFALLIANPTQTTGYFHATHHSDRGRWHCMRVAASAAYEAFPELGDPGPGVYLSPRPTMKWVMDMATKYGVDSDVFRVRVLGLFPKSDDNQSIPLEWIEAALHRELEAKPRGALSIGIDVARFGADASAAVIREGKNVNEAHEWRGNDISQSTGRVVNIGKSQASKLGPDPEDKLYFFVDVCGMGCGVADNLRAYIRAGRDINDPSDKRDRWVVIDVDSGDASKDGLTHRNRDQLWWRAREWFREGTPSFNSNIEPEILRQLMGELASPRYDFLPSGSIKIESKDDMKKRKVPSPNLADALIYTFEFNAMKPEPRKATGWRDIKAEGPNDWMVR